MSERDKATDTSKPPTLKRDWRFYAGMTALVLAVILPLGAFIVPMLGLPLAQSALLVGVLVAGGPEVLCVAAIALLGKETFQYLAHHAKLAFRRAVVERPASKARYYVGLADRKSTRLNSSHLGISYAVFCLKKKIHTGSVAPSFGRRVSNSSQLHSLQNTWSYGYSMLIAV